MSDERAAVSAARDILEDLAAVAVAELVAMWDGLGSYDKADVARLAAAAAPLVTAIVAQSSATEAALLAEITGTLPAVEAAPIIETQMAALQAPFRVTWKALGDGHQWEAARGMGRNTIEAYAQDVPYQAARDTAAAAPGPRQRWVRVISGKSCSWCQFFSTLTYRTAETAAFGHQRCDCMVLPKTPEVSGISAEIRDAAAYDERAVIAEIERFNRRKKRRS